MKIVSWNKRVPEEGELSTRNMNESLRDVVDLSTVVGTVSTALLTCNSPNYTNNKNTLVNISQVFTSSSSTTTAIKDTMIFILHVLKCRTFFFFYTFTEIRYYQRYFVESFMITNIFLWIYLLYIYFFCWPVMYGFSSIATCQNYLVYNTISF